MGRPGANGDRGTARDPPDFLSLPNGKMLGAEDEIMDSEDAVWRDFVSGPLTWDQAINRLIGMGYLREDADDLVNEWAAAAEADAER